MLDKIYIEIDHNNKDIEVQIKNLIGTYETIDIWNKITKSLSEIYIGYDIIGCDYTEEYK